MVSINELLLATPSEIRDFVDLNLGDEDLSFNWLGLALVMASEARSRTADNESIEYAEIAIGIYEELARRAGDKGHGFDDSAAAVRVTLLQKGSVAPDHPTLGLPALWNGFIGIARIAPDLAATRATTLLSKLAVSELARSEDKQEIRSLRKIKNRLGILRVLSSENQAALGPEYHEWLTIYDRLP